MSSECTTATLLRGVDLSGCTAAVTGASSGLGRETARALASVGAQVVAAVRDIDKTGAVLLINNAGVMATPLLRTVQGFELQRGTNHLGHFLFTNGQSKSANILFTVELERRLAPNDIHAFAVHPGVVATSGSLDAFGGSYLEDCVIAEPHADGVAGGYAAHAVDPDQAARLWEWSEQQLALV